MRSMRFVSLLAVMVASACGGEPEEGWDFPDEVIIINTEDGWGDGTPGGNPGDPNDPNVEDPEDPNNPNDRDPRDPMRVPEEREPTVSPVSCDAEFEVVAVPGTIHGRLDRGRGSLHEMPCGISPGNEVRYTLDVPRDMGVEIVMEYDDSVFPPILLLQSGCGEDTRDRMCSSPIGSHPPGYNAHMRARLEAGQYTLVVDERNLLDYGEGGSFSIHINEVDLAPTATCDTPEQLWPDNVGVIVEPNSGTTGDIQTCFGTTRSRHYWKLEVPPGQSYRVRAQYENADEPQGPLVFIGDGCDAACQGHGEFGAVSVANESDEPRTYWVGVTDFRDMGYEVFVDRTARLEDNISCDAARHLEANRPVQGHLMAGSDFSPVCGGNMSRQLFYSVDVPPGHRLLADAPGTYVGVLESCNPDEQICVGFEVNDTNQTQREIITVGHWDGGDHEFTLNPRVVEVASNSQCDAPERLSPGQHAWGYFINGREPEWTCGFVHPGYMLYYEVTVPANTTATVEAQGGQNGVNIGVIDECGGMCLASHDTYLQGPGPVTLDVTNDTNEEQKYIIQAAAADGFTGNNESYVVLQVKLP